MILGPHGYTSADIMSGEKIFQSFDFGNDGAGYITEAKIQYGNVKLPSPFRIKYPPNHMAVYSETMIVAIPEVAQIQWRSEDGKNYMIEAPIKSLIINPKTFLGFRFYFVDDHVDIYLTERINTPGPYLNIKHTKVYSSISTKAP